jgi:hypothetical protein
MAAPSAAQAAQSAVTAPELPDMQCLAWVEACSRQGGGCAFAPADCAISVPRAHEVHFQPVTMGEGGLERHYLCLHESDGAADAVYGDGDFMRAMGLCTVDAMRTVVMQDQARRFDPAAVAAAAASSAAAADAHNLGAMCLPGTIPILHADRTLECLAPGQVWASEPPKAKEAAAPAPPAAPPA